MHPMKKCTSACTFDQERNRGANGSPSRSRGFRSEPRASREEEEHNLSGAPTHFLQNLAKDDVVEEKPTAVAFASELERKYQVAVDKNQRLIEENLRLRLQVSQLQAQLDKHPVPPSRCWPASDQQIIASLTDDVLPIEAVTDNLFDDDDYDYEPDDTAHIDFWQDDDDRDEDYEESEDSFDAGETSAAFVSASLNRWPKVRFLLRAGYDVNSRYSTDTTEAATNKQPSLMVRCDHTLLHMAAEQGDLEAVLMLIDFGADLDLQDNSGATPLMLAAFGVNADVVEALLSNGADVKIVTHDGSYLVDRENEDDGNDLHDAENAFFGRDTCLHYALKLQPNAMVVRLLLQYGVDVNAQDGLGWTALHFSVRGYRSDISKIILATPGVNLELVSKDTYHEIHGANPGGTPLYYATRFGDSRGAELLVAAGANPNVTDRGRKKSPFHYSAACGDVSLMRKLAASGADVYWCNCDGENALMMAASNAQIDAIDELFTNLAPAIDINATSIGGKTALMWAIEFRYPEVVRRLMRAGADVNVTDHKGNTALHWAVRKGNKKCAEVLLNISVDDRE